MKAVLSYREIFSFSFEALFNLYLSRRAGRPVPAGLFDITMYMFHNAKGLVAKGSRPLLYQPKLESFEEAVLIHGSI
jgi:malate synthase